MVLQNESIRLWNVTKLFHFIKKKKKKIEFLKILNFFSKLNQIPNGAAERPVIAPNKPVFFKKKNVFFYIIQSIWLVKYIFKNDNSIPGQVNVANVFEFGSDGWYTNNLAFF